MARARINLFPKPKQERPSNNVQPVFGNVDPYRRQATQGQIPGTIPPKDLAARMLEASAGLIPGPTGEPTPTSLDALRVLQGLLPANGAAPVAGAPQPVSTYTGGIAQELAGTLAGNPFISPEGKARLGQGLSPLLGDIQAAFFRQTEPQAVQRLLALLQASGLPGETVAHTIEAGRPRGFR